MILWYATLQDGHKTVVGRSWDSRETVEETVARQSRDSRGDSRETVEGTAEETVEGTVEETLARPSRKQLRRQS